MVLLAIAISVFGFFVVGSLPVHSRSLPTPALGMAAAVVLVAFLLSDPALRCGVPGGRVLLAGERGVGGQPGRGGGLPLIVEVAFLFDLLVAVVVFGVLMRVHHGRTQTLSTNDLDRLRG